MNIHYFIVQIGRIWRAHGLQVLPIYLSTSTKIQKKKKEKETTQIVPMLFSTCWAVLIQIYQTDILSWANLCIPDFEIIAIKKMVSSQMYPITKRNRKSERKVWALLPTLGGTDMTSQNYIQHNTAFFTCLCSCISHPFWFSRQDELARVFVAVFDAKHLLYQLLWNMFSKEVSI